MTYARDRVTPTGLADEIAFRLQAAILEGEYGPGTHLQQDELCQRFGVSRTPVREALRKLQAQHLVEIVPNKGATVRARTRSELTEVYQLRAELEGFAAELASSRMREEDIAALDDAQVAMEKAVALLEARSLSAQDEPSFNTRITVANETFHAIIHEAASNHRLRATLVELQQFFPKDYVWRAVRSSDLTRTIHVDQHQTIRDALAAGDAATARRAMSDHVTCAGELLLAYLDDHGFWA